jgi:hypothetical protein
VLQLTQTEGVGEEGRVSEVRRWKGHRHVSRHKTISDNLDPTLANTVKVKFALEQAMKAQNGSVGIVLLFL